MNVNNGHEDNALCIGGKIVSKNDFVAQVNGAITNLETCASNLNKAKTRIQLALTDAKVLCGKYDEKEDGTYTGNKRAIRDLEIAKKKFLGIWEIWGTVNHEKNFDALKSQLTSVAEVLKDVADSQFDAENVISDVLSYQADIANGMKFLLGVAAVNSYQCNWMVNLITMRIKQASKGELNQAEVECLNDVLKDLQVKQDHFKAIGDLSGQVSDTALRLGAYETILSAQVKKGAAHDVELEHQRKRDDEHDAVLSKHEQKLKDLEEVEERVNENAGKIGLHDSALKSQVETDARHDKELDRQRDRDKVHDARLDDHERRIAAMEAVAAQVSSNRGRIYKQELALGLHDKKIEDIETAISAQREQIDAVRENLSSNEKRLSAIEVLEEQLPDCVAKIAEHGKNLKDRGDKEAELESRLLVLENRLTKLENAGTPLWLKIVLVADFIFMVAITVILALRWN